MATRDLNKLLKNTNDFIDWFFSLKNTKLITALTKEWKLIVRTKFIRRKSLGLPTSGRLENSIYFSQNPEDGLRYDFKVISRSAPDGTGGRCVDYVAALNSGFSANKPSMGKWIANSRGGRKVDAQLFDYEGNPIGTHPGMLPKLPAAIKEFHIKAEKIIVQQYTDGLKKAINKR